MIEKLTSFISETEENVLNSSELSRITSRQLNYIEGLKENPMASLSVLAEKMGVSKPTASVAVNKLINDGYIEKKNSAEDKRKIALQLTEKGIEITKKHDRAHHILCESVSNNLSKAETEELISLVMKIIRG